VRQIFTSPRLENVEAVAKLLNDAGIQTWVSERRSYKGNRRRTFSYKDEDAGQQPGVWIVNADDLTRARELMRTAGLLETTKPDSYLRELPESPYRKRDPGKIASRLRLVLLAGVVLAATFSLLRTCSREEPIDERHIVPVYTTPP
jgi:hypothetical protein